MTTIYILIQVLLIFKKIYITSIRFSSRVQILFIFEMSVNKLMYFGIFSNIKNNELSKTKNIVENDQQISLYLSLTNELDHRP